MSKKALYLLGTAIIIILGTCFYPKLCCNCMKPLTINSVEKPIAANPEAVIAIK